MKLTILLFALILIIPTLSFTQDIAWWYDLNAPSFGSSACADIDGDGHLEIVFGTYFNDEHIYALNAEDGSLLWTFFTNGCNDASPVIYDVDLDDELEVIVPASSPYRVYCLNGATGAVEWETSTGYPNCIDSPPAVADVDNDDLPEIVFGTFYGNVFCLNGEDGSVEWQVNLGTNSYIQSCPAILDCDDDGQLDIVVAQWQGDCRIYALRGNDGSVLWFSDAPEDWMYHGPSFADIDEDGLPELTIGCYDGDVYCLNAEDGSLHWEYSNVLYCGAPTSIADLNNDGHLETVFVTYMTVKVLSYRGNLLWSYGAGGSVFRGCAISDMNGNGILDLVFGADNGQIRVVQGNDGSLVWSYDLEGHYGRTYNIDHAPVIADFDEDGTLDVFIIGGYGSSSTPTNNHGRGYMITDFTGTGPNWTMFRHDARHSGTAGELEYEVSIELTPLNPPIIIGAAGGSFNFIIAAANTGTSPFAPQIWCNVTLPNGSVFGPTIGPVNFNLPSGFSGERERIQYVPGNAPEGTYTYHAYIGGYPNWIIDQDSFEFEKTGVDFAGSNEWLADEEAVSFMEGQSAGEKCANFSVLPNPFNQQTTINYKLQAASYIELKIYDITGREVWSAADGSWQLAVGEHSVVWDAEGMSSGVYFVRLAVDGGQSAVKKMVLVK